MGISISASVPAFYGELGAFQAGVALPIAKARLQIAGVDRSKAVAKKDKQVAFMVDLPAGKTLLQTWFLDQDGEELCGAYYVCVRRLDDRAASD